MLNGYLYLTGRSKDVIIRGGVNISPVEIDNIVRELVGIAEAAAIGVPDDIHGEAIVVVAVRAPGADLSAAATCRPYTCRALQWSQLLKPTEPEKN
jgi:acyl-CoA synthetase (AMP-forming)/AMP-acid ligase II